MIRVLVSAAYPAVRAGLRAMLDGAEGLTVAGIASPAQLAAGESGAGDPFDVLVMDLDDHIESSPAPVEAIPVGVPVVLLAVDPSAFEGLTQNGGGAAAARAYLLRQAGAEEIAAAVSAVAQGLVVFDPEVARALAGPRAALLPSGNRVLGGDAAVEGLAEPLTEREDEVLGLLALGLPNKGIALRLGISEHTVKFHVGAILAKLGAAGRTEAVMVAARRGLLPL